MPPATRSRKQAPPKNTSKPALAAETSTVLQPKSTNSLKRPFQDDLAKKGKESIPLGPKAKRVATTKSTTKDPTPDLTQVSPWDVQGTYRVDVEWPKIDSTGFSLSIYHANRGHDGCEYYAAFQFDRIEGIMRLCPQPEPSNDDDPKNKMELKRFEEACCLDAGVKPGPNNKKWVMRWRGREGGMHLGKKVGEEMNGVATWRYDLDGSCESTKFQGIQVIFVFAFDGNLFLVNAKKIAKFERGERAMLPQKLRDQWHDLRNSDWELESDSEPESDLNLNGSKSISSAPRKLGRIISPRNSIPVVRQGSQRIGVPALSEYIELRPEWAYDVTGHWEVDGMDLDSQGIWKLGAQDSLTLDIRMSNNPRHSKIQRQLWATFDFAGKIIGTMRFCPQPKSEEPRARSVREFEKACILSAGCWPGPEPNGQCDWNARWRGEREGRVVTWLDSIDADVSFEKDSNGQLIFTGVFMNENLPTLFTAKKIKDASPQKGNATTVTTSWDKWKRKQKATGQLAQRYLSGGLVDDSNSE
ncbi:hypothetical protein EG329_009075 [Mollisiaceae sp. DMI_Dod_QoI]|nr:hypothetical protein EG329_009075 [Helotiales sp. DMI_Dod_QoI]